MLYGWLSPEGQMYECDDYEHLNMAYYLCGRLGFSAKSLPDEVLIGHGWIKCYCNAFDYGVQLYSNEEGFITEAQKNFLRHNYEEFPNDWGKGGKLELKFLGVLGSEDDGSGYLVG